ncbi:hypothetical protein SIN01_29230 [Sporolactobacillus inulinus]|nr:hypothetical protein SIN01_29230 [Sporolactobacillus inulinus]
MYSIPENTLFHDYFSKRKSTFPGCYHNETERCDLMIASISKILQVILQLQCTGVIDVMTAYAITLAMILIMVYKHLSSN